MILVDCNNLQRVLDRTYGGATGSKIAVRYNGCVWMLKTQQILKNRTDMKNIEISYANDPVSEYIGSHVYSIAGLPVHETILGSFNSKICVLCSDKAYPGKLFELREFRNTLMDDGILQPSNGMSTSISDIMQTIELSVGIDVSLAKQRFWDQFVIDAIIGNTDRNNGNWGFLFDGHSFVLYDVYDCGGCLNNKRSDKQLENDLLSGKILTMALNYSFNFKDITGKRLNPFHYLRRNDNEYIQKSLATVKRLDMGRVYSLVDSVMPVISDVRASFYKEIMRIRYEEILKIISDKDSINDLARLTSSNLLED